jgi:hypothetical protein
MLGKLGMSFLTYYPSVPPLFLEAGKGTEGGL